MPKATLALAPDYRPPRSPSRQTLAEAIERKTAANLALSKAAHAVTAVSALIAAESDARAKADAALAENAETITRWAQDGCTGNLDLPAEDLVLQLESLYRVAQKDAEAARLSLPPLQKTFDSARANLDVEQRALSEATKAVLMEAATDIAAEIAQAGERIATLRNQLNGLGEFAFRTPGAAAMAQALRQLLDRPMPEVTEAASLASYPRWRAFAARLATDPDAQPGTELQHDAR